VPAISLKKEIFSETICKYRERLGKSLDSAGVSLSVGITRQVAHGTLLIFGDGLLF